MYASEPIRFFRSRWRKTTDASYCTYVLCLLSLLYMGITKSPGMHPSILSASHTHTQQFYGCLDFVRDNPGEPVPEETFAHSPIVVISHPLSASSLYYDPNGILPIQFTYLTVFFHNLSPSFFWSTSWPGTLKFMLHTFLHPVIVFFSQNMPIPSQRVLL